ncbi:MAG: hypothetical protein RLO50_15920 [Azospirillaceae bacterium]
MTETTDDLKRKIKSHRQIIVWALIFGLGIGFFAGFYLGTWTTQQAVLEGISPITGDEPEPGGG